MNSFSTILKRRVYAGVAGWLLMVAAVLAAGCSSLNKPASASFASVIISNQSVEKIKAATVTVFTQNGYQLMSLPDSELVFQREATRREQIDYAGFVGAHQGEPVVIRVRLSIEPSGVGAYLLGCKAYAVCNPGQPVFETSTALFNFQSGSYQRLLDNVKGTVQQPAVTP
jgi:hypothetical protein